jgi:putative transcriptional regulator
MFLTIPIDYVIMFLSRTKGGKMMKNVRVNNLLMRVEMTKKRLTNEKLSAVTGVSKATLSAVRNGKTCSYATAEKIARAFDKDVSELLTKENE